MNKGILTPPCLQCGVNGSVFVTLKKYKPHSFHLGLSTYGRFNIIAMVLLVDKFYPNIEFLYPVIRNFKFVIEQTRSIRKKNVNHHLLRHIWTIFDPFRVILWQ